MSYFKNVNDVLGGASMAFYVLGFSAFVTTAVFYWGLHSSYEGLIEGVFKDNVFSHLTAAVFWIHIAVGFFVILDATFYERLIKNKLQVFVQAFFIIGPGSFNTFVVASLFSTSIAYGDVDATSIFDTETNDIGLKMIETNLAALICACLSNAMMLALIFLPNSGTGVTGAKINGRVDANKLFF